MHHKAGLISTNTKFPEIADYINLDNGNWMIGFPSNILN